MPNKTTHDDLLLGLEAGSLVEGSNLDSAGYQLVSALGKDGPGDPG
jgi:hypothetical protein